MRPGIEGITYGNGDRNTSLYFWCDISQISSSMSNLLQLDLCHSSIIGGIVGPLVPRLGDVFATLEKHLKSISRKLLKRGLGNNQFSIPIPLLSSFDGWTGTVVCMVCVWCSCAFFPIDCCKQTCSTTRTLLHLRRYCCLSVETAMCSGRLCCAFKSHSFLANSWW